MRNNLLKWLIYKRGMKFGTYEHSLYQHLIDMIAKENNSYENGL